eukprot:COSAG06_NODE_29842_length_549_cov_1.964444_1_plen_119_part_10
MGTTSGGKHEHSYHRPTGGKRSRPSYTKQSVIAHAAGADVGGQSAPMHQLPCIATPSERLHKSSTFRSPRGTELGAVQPAPTLVVTWPAPLGPESPRVLIASGAPSKYAGSRYLPSQQR